MSVLIFFIILSVLVVVHELGHFLVARWGGIRVDEFGLGYPPRAAKLFSALGTVFTVNWLPFGGFVKIYGEDPTAENLGAKDSFQSKNRGLQAAVLAAGVFFNFLFAWLLISFGLMAGLPAPAGFLPIENPQTVITFVVPDSPASAGGLLAGDAILSIDGVEVTPETAAQIIASASGELDFEVSHGKEVSHKFVTPKAGVVAGQQGIGVAMEVVGIAELGFWDALVAGLAISWNLLAETAQALWGFITQAFTGKADLSSVAGPVGLVGLVGEAHDLGWGYLLFFTAIISINLAIINLLPFPALDGGRLLFVGIEALTRRRIPFRVYSTANAVGFGLLILLMIIITVHDVKNLF